jgi:hypothetical protein
VLNILKLSADKHRGALVGGRLLPMTLDHARLATAYWSENKAPAAQLNGAGAVSALLGSLDLKARHLPHDLRTVTLRTLEALCSLALILTN